MIKPSTVQFRRLIRLRLARFMAGLLLMQSLAPALAYALMAPAADGPELSWCSARGVTQIPADQSPGAAQHFRCPACLFYGQLACGAGAIGLAPAAPPFHPFQPPAAGLVLPVTYSTPNTCPIRAPPVSV